MKVALYLRVSSRDGSQDTENQLAQLTAHCSRNGWSIVETYRDEASGKSGARGQFQELLADASKRKFDAVLVWALDRFTREGVAETFIYIKRLMDTGIAFISLSEPHFSTTGPAGELMIAVAAWIAKQERLRISERTKAGLERARRAGKTLGRHPRIFDRGRARDLRASGHSFDSIAKELGVAKSTVVFDFNKHGHSAA